ncbi:Serine/threonine-protein phosphatase 2A 55 kDa regulatory subunit B beta isoform, partial [Galemys pyrenaicus]
DIISTVEFNHTGELLATGDKGGRVVIFQREQESKNQVHRRGEYNVYSTFQSHEPEFDYLKSLEIEEKINKIRWLPQQNAAYFLLSTNDKTVKLWKVSERDKRPEGYNLKDEEGRLRDPATITTLRVSLVTTVPPSFNCLAPGVGGSHHVRDRAGDYPDQKLEDVDSESNQCGIEFSQNFQNLSLNLLSEI